jgi:hypothetical protein
VIVKLPELRVGSLSFYNISATFARRGLHTKDLPLIGNAILKRFNVIIDNRNGYIYLKANSLVNTPYDNTLLYIYGGFTIATLILILIVFLIVYGYKKRRLKKMEYMMPDTPILL